MVIQELFGVSGQFAGHLTSAQSGHLKKSQGRGCAITAEKLLKKKLWPGPSDWNLQYSERLKHLVYLCRCRTFASRSEPHLAPATPEAPAITRREPQILPSGQASPSINSVPVAAARPFPTPSARSFGWLLMGRVVSGVPGTSHSNEPEPQASSTGTASGPTAPRLSRRGPHGTGLGMDRHGRLASSSGFQNPSGSLTQGVYKPCCHDLAY